MGNRNATRETTLRQVETLAKLALIGPLIRQDRDMVLVEDERAIYVYDKTATATADGVNIVEPDSGSGRWYRGEARIAGLEPSVQAATILNPSGGSPTKGQRWLIRGTGAGGWAGKDNHIAEYVSGTVTDASSWRFIAPVSGMLTTDEVGIYLYDGSEWKLFSATLDQLITGTADINAGASVTISAATLGGSYGDSPAFATLMTSGDGTASRVETAVWSGNDLVITLDAASTGTVTVSYFVDARE